MAAADTMPNKASNLAAEMLLQLTAELAGASQGDQGKEGRHLELEAEVRVDPSDGKPYPLESFIEVYGLEVGLVTWESLDATNE